MRIFLNDDAHDVEAVTLAAALDALGVAATARQATKLSDGDRVEVLAPMQGG